MKERMVMHNRPDDDTLGAPKQNTERLIQSEEMEKNEREHLDLRVQFAKNVSRVMGVSLEEAMTESTDLFARIFREWLPKSAYEKDPRWLGFLNKVHEGADPIEEGLRLRKETLAAKKDAPPEPREFFGPFRYDYVEEDGGTIRIHFGSMEWSPDDRDAPAQFTKDTRSALINMFTGVKQRHPEAKMVSGGSWLYTRILESQKLKPLLYELFPRSFVDSHVTEEGLPSRGGGRWGQFVDNRGRVHKRAEEFLERMKEMTKEEDILNAFPIQPTLLEAPIQDFYKKYEIE